MQVPATAVQSTICIQVFDTGQRTQAGQELGVEMRKYAVSGRGEAVPVIERALLLDRVAVLHPRRVIERGNIALERLGHAGLEEIVDHDVRKRQCFGKGAAQSFPVDIGPDHG